MGQQCEMQQKPQSTPVSHDFMFVRLLLDRYDGLYSSAKTQLTDDLIGVMFVMHAERSIGRKRRYSELFEAVLKVTFFSFHSMLLTAERQISAAFPSCSCVWMAGSRPA